MSDGDEHILTKRVRLIASMSRLSPNMLTFERRSDSNMSQMSVSTANKQPHPIITRALAIRVLSSVASVCMSVCLCVCTPTEKNF